MLHGLPVWIGVFNNDWVLEPKLCWPLRVCHMGCVLCVYHEHVNINGVPASITTTIDFARSVLAETTMWHSLCILSTCPRYSSLDTWHSLCILPSCPRYLSLDTWAVRKYCWVSSLTSGRFLLHGCIKTICWNERRWLFLPQWEAVLVEGTFVICQDKYHHI